MINFNCPSEVHHFNSLKPFFGVPSLEFTYTLINRATGSSQAGFILNYRHDRSAASAHTAISLSPASILMALCKTPGCERTRCGDREFCCSDCGLGGHSRRCDRRRKRLLRLLVTVCITDGCSFLVGRSHTHCCSECGFSMGLEHKRSCKRRQSKLQAETTRQMPADNAAHSIDLDAMD